MALKLLVSLDGSGFSEGILAAAERTAELGQAEVFLLHVNRRAQEVAVGERHYDPVGDAQASALLRSAAPNPRVREVETAIQASERARSEALDYLRPIAARFPGGAQCVVREGKNVATEIIACAQEVGADLIAMATHGHRGLSDVLRGSVASELRHISMLPVLMVRGHPHSPPGPQPAV